MAEAAEVKNWENADDHSEIRDVNERLVIAAIQLQELAETAVETEQRLRDFIYGLDAVICEVDVESGETTFLSLGKELFLGNPVEYWRSYSEFLTLIIHPSDRNRVSTLFPTPPNNRQNGVYDFRAVSDDDTWIFMRNIIRVVNDAEGKVQKLRCVIIDVTAEKRIEHAIKEASARERDLNDALQKSILYMPSEDSFPGLIVNRIYEAASDEAMVGGDFSDAFACDHGHVALIVGDVMGHGLPAAMFTAELKYALRGFVREHVNPGRIMEQMNAYLCESSRLFREGLNSQSSGSPLCLVIAIVDTVTGRGLAASSGMEPPLIVRHDGILEEINIGGLLLGIDGTCKYDEADFLLEHGDSLILTTDGITEAHQNDTFLGYEGMKELAQIGWSQGSLQAIGKSIVEGSRKFASGKLRDDVCILLAQKQ